MSEPPTQQQLARIKVGIRIRPFLQEELQEEGVASRLVVRDKKVHLTSIDGTTVEKSYDFDYAFDQQVGQSQVYTGCEVDKLVDRAIEGYHSTILAYGQTGSGKTYTMQGIEQATASHDGIIPRVSEQLFRKIRHNSSRSFTVWVSFLQIYNERIYDLLNPAAGNPRNLSSNLEGLRLRWNKHEQFSVENLFVFECRNAEELNKYFAAGLKNRATASHRLNMSSSRSHSILTIRVESFDTRRPTSILTSKIQLVDLAGSERIGQTGTEGKLAKESIDINKSLFTLRQVISTLADWGRQRSNATVGAPHVPYRQSKLTSILKQSIGGSSYCLMIACISPNSNFLEENISTLNYATKATLITNKPIKNTDPSSSLVDQLTKQVKDLNQQLSKANRHIELISSQRDPPQKGPSQQPQTVQSLFEATKQSFYGQSQKTQAPGGGTEIAGGLIESINMVRQLLRSNKQLRESLDQCRRAIENKDSEIVDLQKQNQSLRDRISELSGQLEQLNDEGRKYSQHRGRNSNAVRRKLNTFAAPAMFEDGQFQPENGQVPAFLQLRKMQSNTVGLSGYLEPQLLNREMSEKGRERIKSVNSVEFMGQTHTNFQTEACLDALPTNFNTRRSPFFAVQQPRSLSLHYKTLGSFNQTTKISSQRSRKQPKPDSRQKLNRTGTNFKTKMRNTFY